MKRVWTIVAIGLLVSGCVGMRPYAVQKKCAWCKAQIVNCHYEIIPVAFTHRLQVRISGRGTYDDTANIGYASTYEDAVKLCEQHALMITGGTFGITKGGVTFCSLRCLNAYEASTGIKEQRIRIIEGE